MPEVKVRPFAEPSLQILLVGAEIENFSLLRSLLIQSSQNRISLHHARNPAEAIQAIAGDRFDLVLCDYESGNGSALRLLQEVHRNLPGIPVAFLSDYVDEHAISAAVTAGVALGRAGADSSIARSVSGAIEAYCRELQHRKAEGTLRKLWLAVEQTADMVAMLDRDGVLEYVNPAFESLTGYSREEAVGRTLRLLKSKQQSPRLYQEMWRTVLEGNVFHGTVVNRRKGGDTFVAEKTVTPLRDAEGRITHFISTDRDISERQRLEAQLQQAQKMDAIGRLAGGVAHDFNNLLMVISAYAELMLDSLAAEHPLRRNVEEIMGASRRAADLTRQLLAFGRKQVQSLQILDLNHVIHEISRMLPRLIGEDIALSVVPGRDLGRVKADPVQIEQVVMNLAANARDAMPRGGKLTIETAAVHLDQAYIQQHSMVPPGRYILLAVTDTGQGIAAEHVPHIFEPFYTTKQPGKGTGLGLATVYGIVKQSGGFIWVYSEVGIGTTFKIYLPRTLRGGNRTSIPLPAENPRGGSETLLLVEDEEAVRRSEREFLELSGYRVLEAGDGEAALRTARDHNGSIDLMITDVVMPQMGGPQLAETLAVERPKMKVLFVSGYAENTILQHGAIDLAARFLQKPFTLKSLSRKIWELLRVEETSAIAAGSS